MTEADRAESEDVAQAPPPKLDPEAFALQGRPSPAIRFRRGLIVALAGTGAFLVAGTAWLALEPHAARPAAESHDKPPAASGPADSLKALPSTYDAVPKLGPPLPGDLGRPILERHRQLTGSVPTPEMAWGSADARERRLAELKAARESGLLVPATHAQALATGSDVGSGVSSEAASNREAKASIDVDRDPNGQQRKADFVHMADRAPDTNPHSLAPQPSPFTLSAGSVISASLISGLRSDLPGLVIAQVTEAAYDSATGHVLLIPQGTRLIGSYDSAIAFGQRRALIIWQRILFPDGGSIRLENAPATDPSGYAGLADKVDFHTWSLLKGVAISTLLGVGAELQLSGVSDLVQAIRQSTQQNVSRAGDQITSRNLQIQPTITIRPGTPVRLIVHQDLILKPWQEKR